MIKTELCPTWVYPNQKEVVFGFVSGYKGYLAVTYDFSHHKWIDSKNNTVKIQGWIRLKR